MWHRQGFTHRRIWRPSTHTRLVPSAAHPQSWHPTWGVFFLVVAAVAAGAALGASLSLVVIASLALLAA